MSSKPPAFQFYPQDYLASTRVAEMTLEEEGVYIRLLCYCWSAGSIPKDPERCAKLAENQRKRREQAAEAGKESAKRRKAPKQPYQDNVNSPIVNNDRSTTVQQNVNPSSSSSSSSSDVYLCGNPDVIVPEKMRTPEVMSAANLWWSHLRLEHPHKLPEPNSPQMQAFWNDANRMGPKAFVDAVNWSAKNHWETLNERPEREQKGFGNGKPTSPSSTAEREKAKLQRILSTGSS